MPQFLTHGSQAPRRCALTVAAALPLCALAAPAFGQANTPMAALAVAFAALALPLAWRYPHRWVAVAVAALAYGGLIEIVQPHVGRGREFADLVADGVGAFSGAWRAARLRLAWRNRAAG